jgi:hypothetical protein
LTLLRLVVAPGADPRSDEIGEAAFRKIIGDVHASHSPEERSTRLIALAM